MSFCPNMSSPEWLALVKHFGDTSSAYTAYVLNNNVIPSVEDAIKLLNNLKVEEYDEQLSKSSDSLKLERTVAQKQVLDVASITANTAQQETISKLQNMNSSYEEFLKDNIERAKKGLPPSNTISVTNFIGSSEFKGDPKAYEDYKLFGTFMHEVIEKAQELATNSSKTIGDVFTKELFDEMYENFTSHTPFEITELTTDHMFELATHIVNNINPYNYRNFILLPEITIVGTDVNNNKIIGRVDMMMIDATGNIRILDFKTKKTSGLVSWNATLGKNIVSVDGALTSLANKEFPITKQKGTSEHFLDQSTRTAYDSWMLQLDVYENILAQHGINTQGKSIITLLYQIDNTGSFKGGSIHVFDEQDYYDQAVSVSLSDDNYWFKEKNLVAERIKTLKKSVSKAIPVSNTDSVTPEAAKRKEDYYDFIPSTDNDKAIKDLVTRIIEGQLKDIYQTLSELDSAGSSNDKLIKLLTNRKDTLQKLKTIVETNKTKSTSDLLRCVNFFTVIDTVEEDLSKLNNISKDAIETFRDKDSDVSKSHAELTTILTAFKNIANMAELVKALQVVVNEASENPDNNITQESNVNRKLGALHAYVENIEASFREIALQNAIHVLKTPGEKTFNKVNDQLRQTLVAEKQYLKRKIETLKEKSGAPSMLNIKHSLLSLVSKSYKQQIQDQVEAGESAHIIEIEQAERRIIQINFILQGYNFDDESLKNYVLSITKPDSILYMGHQNTFNTDVLLQGFKLDSAIASASNSEIAVAAPTLLLKNAEAQARENVFADTNLLQLDRAVQALRNSGMPIEKINQMLSSYREVVYYNHDTNELEKKKVLFVTKPYSEEYENTFRTFDIKLKQLNKELYSAKAEFFDNYNTDQKDTYEQAYKDKLAERNKHLDENLKWLTENSVLPYADEFYGLQQMLPAEIRDAMQKIYLEKEIILHSVSGAENAAELESYDYDRLQELDIELNNLKEEAKKINPAYEEYIKKFNDLYELSTDEDRFSRAETNAKARFADDPDMLEKWYKENQVERPKEIWYDELNTLYELRAQVVSSNPVMQDLLEERAAILRKYKINGKLAPKFISDEDVEALDEIEARTEFIMANNKTPLTYEERERLSNITQKINQLTARQLSTKYLEELKTRTKSLFNSKRMMDEAIAKQAEARSTGDKKAQKKYDKEIKFFTTQFHNLQTEYELWYNKFHDNKYETVLTGFDPEISSKPKSFLYQRVPNPSVKSKYTETVPSPKFYTVKTLRKERWYLHTDILNTKQIEELKADRSRMISLLESGDLIIKPGVENPDFSRTPDGIPMPKGITKVGDEYSIIPGFETSSNIDEQFKEIQKNKDVKDVYNKLIKTFFKLQKQTEGKKIGYQVPGYAENTVESYHNEGSLTGAFDKQWKTFIDKHAKFSNQDVTDNAFGDLGARIRMRHTVQLPENIQSKDAIGSVMKYAVEAHGNIAFQQTAPVIDTYIEHLKLIRKDIEQQSLSGPVYTTDETGKKNVVDMSKRLKEIDTVIDTVEYERRKLAYGQADLATNRVLKKRINALFGYISFARIGFDAANQIKNSLSGNLQSYMAAAGSDSAHYSKKDWIWSKGQVYKPDGFIANYFKDWGRISDVSESTLLYRHMNPSQKEHSKYFEGVTGGRGRKAKAKMISVKELGYLLQDKGDTEIAVTIMYAVMNNYKFALIHPDGTYQKDADGNNIMISAHQCYYVNNEGVLKRRTDVEYSKEDEAMLRNIINSEMRRAQGNYAKVDQTKFEESIMGKMVFFFRKFLVPQLLNRFGYLRPSWEGSDVALGYWRALFYANKYFGMGATMKEFVLGSKLAGKVGGKSLSTLDITNDGGSKVSTSFYAAKIAHARKDAIAMASLTILALMLLSYVKGKDDDDEELGVLEGNAIRILWGVKGETVSMFPIGGGSGEYIKNFTTAIPFVREAVATQKLVNHSSKLLLAMMLNGGEEPDPGYTSDFYEEVYKDAYYTRDSGPYEKGDAKIIKDFYDLTGLKNFRDLLSPENRIDNIKGKQ